MNTTIYDPLDIRKRFRDLGILIEFGEKVQSKRRRNELDKSDKVWSIEAFL